MFSLSPLLALSMSCALCPTPFAQQHLKLSGPPNSGRSVAEWAPSLKKATGASRPSLQQRLPGAEGPPEGRSTAPRHAACGGPIPSSRGPVLISFLPKGSFLPFPSCARASLPRGLGHPCRRAAATTACDLPMQSVTPAWLATTSCGLRLRCSRNSSGHAPALLREGCRRELLRRTRTFPSIHNASAH